MSGLQADGFEGYFTVNEIQSLMRSRKLGDTIPSKGGVYLLVREDTLPPKFLKDGTVIRLNYKKLNPNVCVSELEASWIEGALIIYIGQSGGDGSQGTLRKRVRTMIRFGEGSQTARHWGGRYVWQLQNAKQLQVCWKTTPDENPRDVERSMINAFKSMYDGRRPFANLRD